jgi:hypothetical protein
MEENVEVSGFWKIARIIKVLKINYSNKIMGDGLKGGGLNIG